MKILVLNAGSSSLKYQLIDTISETAEAKGVCERIGLKGSILKARKEGSTDEIIIEKDMPSHTEAISLVLDTLVNGNYGVVKSMDEISAVGHRVVHSGEDFDKSVLITDEVIRICEKNAELAPLHVPANIMGIKACRKVMPDTPMVAVFDTAFHSTMPEYAYMYAVAYEDYQNYKLRRYGFHGTSHKYVSQEAAAYLKRNINSLKIITCHLGNGSSIAAVNGGKSVDTSMGFTPLEGLPMGTRCGDIDPAAIEYIMAKKGFTITQAIDYLNKKCGVLGISGVSSDFRDLVKAAGEGNKRAKLALDIFCYRIKKFIGAYAAVMNGLDCLVFTAGIGENTSEVREKVLSGMDYIGIKPDLIKNKEKNNGGIRDIPAIGGKVKILIIPTNEELVIARETYELVK
jgi:acetate kinase